MENESRRGPVISLTESNDEFERRPAPDTVVAIYIVAKDEISSTAGDRGSSGGFIGIERRRKTAGERFNGGHFKRGTGSLLALSF